MRDEKGTLSGDMAIDEAFTLWGSILGNVRVLDGSKFYLRGAVYGNIYVEPGGRMHIFGQVMGDVHLSRGTKVIHSGLISGNVINDGGRFFRDADGQIQGKVKTHAGESRV